MWAFGCLATINFLMSAAVPALVAWPMGIAAQAVMSKLQAPIWLGTIRGKPYTWVNWTILVGDFLLNFTGIWAFAKGIRFTDAYAVGVELVPDLFAAQDLMTAIIAVVVALVLAAGPEVSWQMSDEYDKKGSSIAATNPGSR